MILAVGRLHLIEHRKVLSVERDQLRVMRYGRCGNQRIGKSNAMAGPELLSIQTSLSCYVSGHRRDPE